MESYIHVYVYVKLNTSEILGLEYNTIVSLFILLCNDQLGLFKSVWFITKSNEYPCCMGIMYFVLHIYF